MLEYGAVFVERRSNHQYPFQFDHLLSIDLPQLLQTKSHLSERSKHKYLCQRLTQNPE